MTEDSDKQLRDLLARVAAIQNYYFEEGRELELPLDINQLNTGGDGAIHVAARDLGPDEIFLLLKNGADVNLSGEFGATPLHCAASSRKLENFVALLKGGANPDIRMYQGIKPVEMVIDNNELRRKFDQAVERFRNPPKNTVLD